MRLAEPDGESADMATADMARLAELLRQDAEARAYYSDFMDLHAQLELCQAEPLELPSGVAPAGKEFQDADNPELVAALASLQRSARSGWGISALMTSAALGACIALLLFGVAGWWSAEGPRQLAKATPKPPSISQAKNAARVERLANCRWVGKVYQEGEYIIPGVDVQLESGSAELVLADGAVVVLEGPSRLTLETSESLFLLRGRIACSMPVGSDGFTVRTPSATVVNLGSEFGVSVKPNGAVETHVSRGLVGFQPSVGDDSSDVVLVSREKGVRLRPGKPSVPEFIRYRSGLVPRFTDNVASIVAHPSSGVVRSHSQGAAFGAYPSDGGRRVGTSSLGFTTSTYSSGTIGLANVLLFRTPSLGKSPRVVKAELEFTCAEIEGDPAFSVDLYGLGAFNRLGHRGDWFYAGEGDTRTRDFYKLPGGDKPVSLLAKGVLTPQQEPGRVRIESKVLAKFVQSLLDEGAEKDDLIVFRLNADARLVKLPPRTGYRVFQPPEIPGVTKLEDLPVLRLTLEEDRPGIARASSHAPPRAYTVVMSHCLFR